MLTAVVISNSADLAAELSHACSWLEDFHIRKSLDAYPPRHEIVQLLNLVTPGIVFVEMDGSLDALRTAREVRAADPETAIVGFARELEAADRQAAAEAGIHVGLAAPFSREKLEQVVARAISRAGSAARESSLFAFLPGKAGSGASTVALHVAYTLASRHDEDVLLMDADLRSGILALLLGLKPEKTILDVLENTHLLTENLWRECVASASKIDLLATPLSKAPTHFSQWDFYHVLAFAQKLYSAVVVDLPEEIGESASAVLQRAAAVFLVCTPEIPSLFLARRRILELEEEGVEESRLGIVLNRCTKKDLIGVKDAEQILRRRVSVMLPNDYAGVRRAIMETNPLSGRSDLARAFESFASKLAHVSARQRSGR